MNNLIFDLMSFKFEEWEKCFHRNKSFVLLKIIERLHGSKNKRVMIEHDNLNHYDCYYDFNNSEESHIVYKGEDGKFIIRKMSDYVEYHLKRASSMSTYKSENIYILFEDNYVNCISFVYTLEELENKYTE